MSHALFLQVTPRPFGENVSAFGAAFWPVLLPAGLGLAAIYLLLPRARRFPPLWGTVLGAVALVLAGVLLVRASAALPETILFYAFSATALVGGALLVTHHNPVYAALAFALVVLSTCGLFLLLAAPFLMAATVIIYAGAIIVTFLFVIMLAQQAGLGSADLRSREPFLATLAGFILLAAILCVLQRSYANPANAEEARALAPLVARAGQAGQAARLEEVHAALGDRQAFFRDFRKLAEPEAPEAANAAIARKPLLHALDEAQAAVNAPAPRLDAVRQGFQEVYREGSRALHALQGGLQPAAGLPLSPFSGAPPNQGASLDPAGRPAERMPAENVASLGRSLFTDYLLTVELAGTLLLVATIGAIAIAGRRAEGVS